MAHIILYDIRLPGDPELIWSPNTSKTRYALNYKGIPYKVIWLTYPEVRSEIPKITKSDRAPTVPVIVDLLHGDKVIQDSWKIAKYLEEAYPNTPSLFNSNAGVHLFFHNYLTDNLLWVIVRLTVLSLMDKTDEDKDYFRRTREDFLGMTLEEYAGDEEGNGKQMTAYLEPIGKVFKVYPYISGTQGKGEKMTTMILINP
ncbi:hypothetical protein BJV82DRAFT_586109 [Fennellomyces sp. T-0311]|nr:hypothetical protein BJV82DRAFT_586109 [Fennellomyces sp. T-0311]